MTGVRGHLGTVAPTQGEHHVMMKADIRVMILQAKECQRFPANQQKLGERHERDPPSQLSEGIIPAKTLTSDFNHQNIRTINFTCLSHPVCGNFLQQSQETNIIQNNGGSSSRANRQIL